MDRAEESSGNETQSAIRHTSDTARSIAQLRLRCIAQIARRVRVPRAIARRAFRGRGC